MGCVYVAQNLVNNKFYVGQTHKPMKWRANEHISDAFTRPDHSPIEFHADLVKFGVDNFYWQEVIQCDNKELRNNYERQIIEQLVSYCPNGYNGIISGVDKKIICVETQEIFDSILSASTRIGREKSVVARRVLSGMSLMVCSEWTGNVAKMFHFAEVDE